MKDNDYNKNEIDVILEAYDNSFVEETNEDAEDMYDIEAEYRPGKKYGEKSFLDVKIEDIYDAKSFDEAAELFKKFTQTSKINPKSKSQILANIAKIESQGRNLVRLQQYATNCWFKMKKMGLK